MPLRNPGHWVDAGDPRLILVPRQASLMPYPQRGRGRETLGQASPLGQVVVIRAAAVGLQVAARVHGSVAVEVRATVHYQHLPVTTNNNPINARKAARNGRPDYRSR